MKLPDWVDDEYSATAFKSLYSDLPDNWNWDYSPSLYLHQKWPDEYPVHEIWCRTTCVSFRYDGARLWWHVSPPYMPLDSTDEEAVAVSIDDLSNKLINIECNKLKRRKRVSDMLTAMDWWHIPEGMKDYPSEWDTRRWPEDYPLHIHWYGDTRVAFKYDGERLQKEEIIRVDFEPVSKEEINKRIQYDLALALIQIKCDQLHKRKKVEDMLTAMDWWWDIIGIERIPT